MIEIFRRASGSIVARIFLGFLAIAFAFMWGGQDALRMVGVSQSTTVAKVGTESISNRDLAMEIERTRINIRQRTGQEISSEDMKKAGLDRQILERLINEALFKIEAKKLNVTVSDGFVVNMLHTQKAFQTPDGDFSKVIFMRFIQAFGFNSEKDYVEYTKAEITRSRLMAALSANASLPMGATQPLYAWNEQVRTAQGMVINPQKMVVKKVPTQDELRDFYGKNTRDFFAPERRTFKAIVFSNTSNIKIDEKEVKVLYDLGRDRKYKGHKEADAKKAIRQKMRSDKAQELLAAQADKIHGQFEEGTSLVEAAKANGAKLIQFTDQPLNEKQATRSDVDQGIVEAAFVAEEGDLSPLEEIKGADKYVMIYLEGRKDPAQLSFSDAMTEVKEAYRRDAQGGLTKDLVEKLQKQLESGTAFKTVATQNKLELLTVRVARQKALTPTAIDLAPAAISQLFAVPQGRLTMLSYRGKSGQPLFLIAKVTDIKNGDVLKNPKALKDFGERLQDQARNDVVESLVSYLRKRNPVEVNKSYFPK